MLCRVRDFEVMDVYPFGVQLTWEKDGAPTTSVVFEQNGPLPSTKSLTFYRYTSYPTILQTVFQCLPDSRHSPGLMIE